MDRNTITQVILIITTLGIFIPFLPGNRNDSLGLGAPWRAYNLNKRLARVPAESVDRRGLTRFGGMQGVPRYRKLMEFAETVKAEAGEGTVVVQARGISRNEMWAMAYDFYPARIVGRYLDDGGGPDDPVLPEADWIITSHLKAGGKLELERVH